MDSSPEINVQMQTSEHAAVAGSRRIAMRTAEVLPGQPQTASELPLGPTARLPELPVGPVALLPQLSAGADPMTALPAADLPTGQLCAGRSSASALPVGAPRMTALPVADAPVRAALPVADAAVGAGHPDLDVATTAAVIAAPEHGQPVVFSITGPVSGVHGWLASNQGHPDVVAV